MQNFSQSLDQLLISLLSSLIAIIFRALNKIILTSLQADSGSGPFNIEVLQRRFLLEQIHRVPDRHAAAPDERDRARVQQVHQLPRPRHRRALRLVHRRADQAHDC